MTKALETKHVKIRGCQPEEAGCDLLGGTPSWGNEPISYVEDTSLGLEGGGLLVGSDLIIRNIDS